MVVSANYICKDRFITACAVTTSCCISDVPSPYGGVKCGYAIKMRHFFPKLLPATVMSLPVTTWEKKFKWEICPHPAKSVKIANGEEMIIHGAAHVPLRVGKLDMDSEILISPYITRVIIGMH